jgi:hypothetical protein
MAITQRVLLKVDCDKKGKGCLGGARVSDQTPPLALKRLTYLGWEVDPKGSSAICPKCLGATKKTTKKTKKT